MLKTPVLRAEGHSVKQRRKDLVFVLCMLAVPLMNFLVFWLWPNFRSITIAFEVPLVDGFTFYNFERFFKELFNEVALNDAAITKGAVARVIQVSVECDGVEASSFSGDGVIVSTPTGSTAYSMSAGGPIVEPSAHNIIITPICAHAVNTKGIVTSPFRTISVRLGKLGRRNAFLSVDGGRAFRLSVGDVVTVRKAEQETKLVRLKQTSFYEILNNKICAR